MRRNINIGYNYLLLLPVFAIVLIPWLKYRISFRYISPILVIWLLFAFLDMRKTRATPIKPGVVFGVIISFSIYSCLDFIYGIFGVGDGMSYQNFVDYVFSLFFLGVFHLSITRGKYKELKFLAMSSLVFLVISAVMAIFGYNEVENASRILTGGGETEEIALLDALRGMGVGAYMNVYSAGIMVAPLLFYASKLRVKLKIVFLLVVALIGVYVFAASFSILTLTMFVVVLTYLFWRVAVRNSVRVKTLVSIVTTVFLIVVIFPASMMFMSEFLFGLADLVSNQEYQYRIREVAESVSGAQESYLSARSELYWKSWITFLEHPFFGVGLYADNKNFIISEGIGGHSQFFDVLGLYGLFGGISLISMLVFYSLYLSEICRKILGYWWSPAYYFFMMHICMIGFINPLRGYLLFFDLFFLVPALAFVFDGKGKLVPGGALPSSHQLRSGHSTAVPYSG